MTTFRAAIPDDLATIIEIGARFHAESPRWSRLPFDHERARYHLRELIASDLGFLQVAVDDDDTIIGGIAARAAMHWSSSAVVCFEEALFIERAHRGGLVAVRLVGAMTMWAFEVGCAMVMVGASTGIDDDTVAAFYERLGFRRASIGLEKFYGVD